MSEKEGTRITDLEDDVLDAHIEDLMEQTYELIDELNAFLQERKRRKAQDPPAQDPPE